MIVVFKRDISSVPKTAFLALNLRAVIKDKNAFFFRFYLEKAFFEATLRSAFIGAFDFAAIKLGRA
jgi:hypothetical protein